MIRRLITTVIALASVACALGQGGFGGGQGGFGGGQGQMMRETNGSAENIDREILEYLNNEEIKTILSPGEFCEWSMQLKRGQVVVAEARSDAFDPALEILDHNGQALAKNDDRYPGDQRPLLLWRCDQDGTYLLHLRCFHDRSGGQAFVRFQTYDSFDLPNNEKLDREVDSHKPFMARISMKAGEIKEVASEPGGDGHYMFLQGRLVVTSSGLPDINLSLPIQPATGNTLIMAPVDGDYYFVIAPVSGMPGKGHIHIWTHDVKPMPLTKQGDTLTGTSTTGDISIWELPIKAGQLIEADTPELNPYCRMIAAEQPDVSKYDVSKPESNPFYPQKPQSRAEPFEHLSARDRDNRRMVLYATRDAKVWLVSNGAGPVDKAFTLKVKPAALNFVEDRPNTAKLQIANTDYWAFEAKAGDVMTLDTKAQGFTEVVVVRDPDMVELRHSEAGIDQSSDQWRMIVQKPGRYLASISCRGDGGGGEYSLMRQAIHPKDFGVGNPAKAEITGGVVQIWKFTVKPNSPVLMRWNSSDWAYDVNIYDERGRSTNFQRDRVDGHNQFGIIYRPGTYVVVLTGTGAKSDYSIELNPIPGYKAQ